MRPGICAMMIVAGLGAHMPAFAEGFVDVFAGRSFPNRTDMRLTADRARVNGDVVPAALRVDVFDVKPSRSSSYGVRAGYWFGPVFGVALDIATISPDVKAQRIAATASLTFDEAVFDERVRFEAGERREADIPRIAVPTTLTAAALAMVRLPQDGASPRRLSPYAFAGPVWLVTDSDLSGNLGVRAGGGARLAVSRRVALFAEYRYTAVNADAVAGRISGAVGDVRGSTGDIRVDFRLRNHSGVGGLSLAF